MEPQYLMSAAVYRDETEHAYAPKVLHMRVGSATNMRTAIACFASGVPSGDTAASFYAGALEDNLALTAVLNSLAFDFVMRARLTGLHLDYHVWEQSPLPTIPEGLRTTLATAAFQLIADSRTVAPEAMRLGAPLHGGIANAERRRLAAALDAVVAVLFGLTATDFARVVAGCDAPLGSTTKSDAKAFWRTDSDKNAELRQPVLANLALADMTQDPQHAEAPEAAMSAFLQPDGDGWLPPETVRLDDHGLGHDDRANHHQPVASHLGPRFYDWQLAQTANEGIRERHLHARNLLGELGHARLLRQLERSSSPPTEDRLREVAEDRAPYEAGQGNDGQPDIFK